METLSSVDECKDGFMSAQVVLDGENYELYVTDHEQ